MKLVGVNNASVSIIDDICYVGVNAVETGTKNSIAFYEEDGHTVSSSDVIKIDDDKIFFDSSSAQFSGVLKASLIELGNTDYISTGQTSFSNLSVNNLTVNKFSELNGLTSLNGLVIITGLGVKIHSPMNVLSKLSIKNKFNIAPKTVTSSKGSKNDFSGDVAFDSKYIYYCVKDFDGVDNIWVRWKITDSEW